VGHYVTSLEGAEEMAHRFLHILDVKPAEVSKLQSLTERQVLDAQVKVIARANDPELAWDGLPFKPVVDGKVIPALPIQAITRNSADNVPILIGTNLDEWKLFAVLDKGLASLDEAGLLQRCQRVILDGDVTGLIEAYR
jgi:para-nitrobenzyl esterase